MGLSTSDSKNLDSLNGLVGFYNPIENDFTATHDGLDSRTKSKFFKNKPEWSDERKDKVKHFRFVVCLLALLALTLGQVSRMILNVSIVDMTVTSDDGDAETATEVTIHTLTIVEATVDPLESSQMALLQGQPETAEEEDVLVFDWSVKEQNFLLASFYIGYAPAIMFSGSIADNYGSKYPLLIGVLASSFINMITPTLARYDLRALICSRIMLGILQGGMLPSQYALFNRWLTMTEASIFAPMIKVSLALGSFLGSLLPGLLTSLGFHWPFIFYVSSALCIGWSLAWIPLASSTPETNAFVDSNELHKITKKKVQPVNKISVVIHKESSSRDARTAAKKREALGSNRVKSAESSSKTPWLLIISYPSVLALTIVKFTYNLGMDFICLELAVYLRKVHSVSTETISAIASGGYLIQVLLITLVGWSAKVLVLNQTFGLSRTKWRKVFQGSSNFAMAALYLLLTFSSSEFWLIICIVVLICFSWMLGAGGESMVAYDLSFKYPATIVGLTHSVSILSGVVLPPVCALILGDKSSDPERWNLIFLLLAGAMSFGGLIFVLVLKSKPFLPGEKELARKPAQIATRSMVK